MTKEEEARRLGGTAGGPAGTLHPDLTPKTELQQFVSGLLKDAAWALRLHQNDLRNWTIEKARREAAEAARVFEGQAEIISRHLTALDALQALLRRAPAGARYVAEALEVRR
jgi:hypothetical protein